MAFGDVTVRRGDLVVFNLPAANRDPDLTDDPERLGIDRTTATRIGFGHGVHHCLSAPLARMEMRIRLPRPAPTPGEPRASPPR